MSPCNTTRQVTSTGLGLEIVKQLVTVHGGALVIQSDASIGTRITVQLPVVP